MTKRNFSSSVKIHKNRGKTMKLCKKCGRPVNPSNSAMRLAVKMEVRAGTIHKDKEKEIIDGSEECHLFEVNEQDGHPPCPGSQSLRQYLPEQARDSRPGRYYNPDLTMVVRISWAQVLKDAENEATSETSFADLNDA